MPIRPDGEESRWTWGKKTSEARINELVAKEIKRENKIVFDIYRIDLLEDEHGNIKREKLKSVWDEKELNYQHARQYFKSLFGSSEIFDFPKAPELIRKMLISLDLKDGIILDFFWIWRKTFRHLFLLCFIIPSFFFNFYFNPLRQTIVVDFCPSFNRFCF